MRALPWLVIAAGSAACSGSPSPRPAAPATQPAQASGASHEPAVAEPARPGARVARDERTLEAAGPGARAIRRPVDVGRAGRLEGVIAVGGYDGPVRWQLDPPNVADSDLWDRCVRELVRAQPEPARKVLSEMFNRYVTACDGEGRAVLVRPLGLDGRERRAQSDVAFAGAIAAGRAELVLRVTACGGAADPDRIAIVAGEASWTSQRLEFTKDSDGCATAELPLTRALIRAVRGLTEAPPGEAMVRFEGVQRYDAILVTEDLRRDLQATLDALSALEP